MLDKTTNTPSNLQQFTETSHSILKRQAYNIALFNNSLRGQSIRQLPKDIIQEQDCNLYNILYSIHSYNTHYTYVDSNDIEKLSLQDLNDECRLGYFYCLYHCTPLIVLDSNRKTTLNNKTAIDNFNYKSSFYLSFIANKDSLSNEYLEARKALYKSMMKLREEKQEHYKKEQNRISQLSYEEYTQEKREQERILREKERQEGLLNKNTLNKDSKLILESKDKSNVIIFLDSVLSSHNTQGIISHSSLRDLQSKSQQSNNSLESSLDSKTQINQDSSNISHISMSNLIHIHNSKIDIFTKDKSIIDIQEIADNYKDYGITLESLNSANTQIFLYSHLLIGSKEILDNPLYFGEIDSKGELDESKPIYFLESNDEFGLDSNFTESNSIDSSNNLNNNTESKSTDSKPAVYKQRIQQYKI